jgi:hypothetical protein
MSRAADDPDYIAVKQRVDEAYRARHVDGRWDALSRLLLKWVPAAPPAPVPTPRQRARPSPIPPRRGSLAALIGFGDQRRRQPPGREA